MASVMPAPEVGPASRDGYGEGLLEAGRRFPDVVALDADLAESTRSQWFAEEFPDRFFQMGISEQDMMVTAAGLASAGKTAFASTFAIFSERGFEQVRNAICRPNLDVKIVGSHGGLMTGQDGSSAQCIEDVAVYRSLPNMRVLVPADAREAKLMVPALAQSPGPAYVRLTRAKVPVVTPEDRRFEIGRFHTVVEGSDAAVLACGPMVGEALRAREILRTQDDLAVAVVNASTIKPLDDATILTMARDTGALVTAEDHNIVGGLGGAVAELLAETRPTPMKRVGVRDVFGESGDPRELYRKHGLTPEALAEAVRSVRARA